MNKVIDYRRHAVECRELAQRSRSDGERKLLLDMAESWESLATVRERNLAQREEL